MPTHAGPGTSALTTLADQLRIVLSQAESGDWDGIVARQREIAVTLDQAQQFTRTPFQFSDNFPVHRSELKTVIQLLDQASTVLAERREQIAPLVNALKSLPVDAQE